MGAGVSGIMPPLSALGPVPVLEARHLAVSRDDRLLFSGLDFQLSPGQVLQVAGPNGVGKTTLLNIVAGLCPAEAGELAWQGRPVADDPVAFRAAFSWLGHQPGLKLMLSPRENLEWLLRLRGLPGVEDAILNALARVDLYGYEDVPVAHLSAGQKRRVALARLFLEGRPLWILDEPFTAIDRAGVTELEGWLRQHAEAGGMVLLTTHHEFAPGFPVTRLDVADFRPAVAGRDAEDCL
ncbi:MAG: ccmA [Moraxellaceae bacterium]|nr:ccmA [Moraxellaceae bacterium]